VNRYPSTSVTKEKYYINKRCTNMGRSKNAKDYHEKKVIYSISKDQNYWGHGIGYLACLHCQNVHC